MSGLELPLWQRSCHRLHLLDPAIGADTAPLSLDQASVILGDPVFPLSLTSLGEETVGAEQVGNPRSQTCVRFSWPLVVQGGACDPRSRQAEGVTVVRGWGHSILGSLG